MPAALDKLDLDRFRDEGLTGAQLLEYAKATDIPGRLQDLLDMTWADIKGKSLGDAQKTIRQYVDAHWELYRSHPKPANHGAPPPIGKRRGKPSSARWMGRDKPPSSNRCGRSWNTMTREPRPTPEPVGERTGTEYQCRSASCCPPYRHS
jgi:hypothetical protein